MLYGWPLRPLTFGIVLYYIQTFLRQNKNLLLPVTRKFEKEYAHAIFTLSTILCDVKLNHWRHEYFAIIFFAVKHGFSAIGNQLQIGQKRIFFKMKYKVNMLSTKYPIWRARDTKFNIIIFLLKRCPKVMPKGIFWYDLTKP